MRLFDQVERKFDVIGHSREMGFCSIGHEWLAADAAQPARR